MHRGRAERKTEATQPDKAMAGFCTGDESGVTTGLGALGQK